MRRAQRMNREEPRYDEILQIAYKYTKIKKNWNDDFKIISYDCIISK